MKKMMKARKGGFTLVELLIVIMIIAILAGMMLLATGSATDSADATKIINDIRSIKSAALLNYVDTGVWPTAATNFSTYVNETLSPYMDRSIDTYYSSGSIESNDSGRIYMLFDITNIDKGVKGKLQKSAKKSGLYSDQNNTEYAGGNTVGMILK